MGRQARSHAIRFPKRCGGAFSAHALYLLGLFAGMCVVMGIIEYQETMILAPSIHFEQLYTFQIMGCMNVLLIGSAMLYVWHLAFGSAVVGRWASRLATVGVTGLVLTLLVRWVETYCLNRPGHVALTLQYEMMALASTVAIVIYLVMEKVYGTRSAGAFVMVIVAGSIFFQNWLLASGQATGGNPVPLLMSYWSTALVMANLFGYGALVTVAVIGVAYLLRPRIEMLRGFAAPSISEMRQIENAMHQTSLIGVSLVSVAVILGNAAAVDVWMHDGAWDSKEAWMLLNWAYYASYFYFHYKKGWRGSRIAWWAIAGAVLTVLCFAGKVNFPAEIPPGFSGEGHSG